MAILSYLFMNIHNEAEGLEKLLQQAQEKDSKETIKPQEANPDIECFGCGS